MEEMEVVDLGEGGGVVHTCLCYVLVKVAVGLDGVLGRSKVGVNGVGTAGGGRVLQLDIHARASDLHI